MHDLNGAFSLNETSFSALSFSFAAAAAAAAAAAKRSIAPFTTIYASL